MFRNLKKEKKAGVVVEYMLLLTFLTAALVAFQNYFMGGLKGRWRDIADTFGFGAVYHPGITNRCAYDYTFHNVWYDLDCFEDICDCETVRASNATCQTCILSCTRSYCD